MARANANDLIAFVAVAKERSFTRAAAKLGVSPSALSHAMRGLEERLGLRLLTRTTRRVTPSEIGERLLRTIGPRFEEIDAEIAALGELRDKPVGTVRITADEYAVNAVLWPGLRGLLREYPDIHVELVTDYGLTDIVAERFDAGVRLGGVVAKDMVAVPIGPDQRMVAVASPSYFAKRSKPNVPQDLTAHTCINLRLPTRGGLYAWEFEKNKREFRVRVEGQLTFNSTTPILEASLDGFGIAYLPFDQVRRYLDSRRLVQLLSEWTPPFSGYHLYYPSRRQSTAAFTKVVEALRYRETRIKNGQVGAGR
jgi:DNA-binding transcriptional LysR family regulator